MINEKHETVADNVSANHHFREVAKMIQHEEVDVSKMETTTPTREKSSAPLRNCDVGTAEEQAERFYAFCGCHRFQSGIKGMCSSLCPLIRCRDMCNCLTKWSQMPYDEGGAK